MNKISEKKRHNTLLMCSMTIKEKIIKSKQENPNATLKQLAEIVRVSINTIQYHLNPKEKQRKLNAMKKRKNNITQLKIELGGGCKICGYNRCLQALDFHHLDGKNKDSSVSKLAISGGSYLKAKKEAEKCVLLCCRCHREVHYGVATI